MKNISTPYNCVSCGRPKARTEDDLCEDCKEKAKGVKNMYKIKLDIHDISEFICATNSVKNDINLHQGKSVASAKSMMGIYALDLSQPINLIIRDCEDAEVVNKFKRWFIET